MHTFTALPDCPPACAVIGRHVATCSTRTPETDWCPQCRTRQLVIDRDPECEDQTGTRVATWARTVLECGHESTSTPVEGARSSGDDGAAAAVAAESAHRRAARAHNRNSYED